MCVYIINRSNSNVREGYSMSNFRKSYHADFEENIHYIGLSNATHITFKQALVLHLICNLHPVSP
jgi:hypothetical protein